MVISQCDVTGRQGHWLWKDKDDAHEAVSRTIDGYQCCWLSVLWCFLSALFFTLFQTIWNSKQDYSAVGKRNTHRTVEGQCTLAQAREQPTKRRQHSDWTQNVKPADTGKQTHGNMLDSECTHTQKEVCKGLVVWEWGGGLHVLGSPGRVNIHLNRQKWTHGQRHTVRRRTKDRTWDCDSGPFVHTWMHTDDVPHRPKGHTRFIAIQNSVQIDVKGNRVASKGIGIGGELVDDSVRKRPTDHQCTATT